MQQRLKASLDECAREVLDVVPLAMSGIREQLRKHGARVLSVPQFRTLLFVSRHKGASLSDVAEHIGLTLPSMSALIDGLVKRDFAVRGTRQDDRRCMTLMLTDRGEATLRSAREGAQAYLTERLSRFSGTERATVVKGMRILKQVFLEEVV
jgi:DNA-binding MarR family transcriptional regulator